MKGKYTFGLICCSEPASNKIKLLIGCVQRLKNSNAFHAIKNGNVSHLPTKGQVHRFSIFPISQRGPTLSNETKQKPEAIVI